MSTVQVSEFIDRVMSTDTLVGFTVSDPNGHLATGRYVDAIVDHRLEAFDRQVGVNWFQIAHDLHVAYVIGEVNLKFLRPLPAGTRMTLASWVTGIGRKSISVQALFIGGGNRTVHALARLETIAVDTGTGRSVEHPKIPARDGAGRVDALPTSSELLATVKGMPET